MLFFRHCLILLPLLAVGTGTYRINQLSVSCKSYYNTSLKRKVFTKVTVEPEFPGGPAQYTRFLNSHFKYPNEEMEPGELQYSTKLQFIVNANGQLTHLTITSPKGTDTLTPFEKEVIRVFSIMPNWVPGQCNGQNVITEMQKPFIVCLSQEDQ